MEYKTIKDIGLLEKCIEHWYENLMILQLNYFSKQNLLDDYSISSKSCSCCGEYFHNVNCLGCPISMKTGRGICYGTPYLSVLNYYGLIKRQNLVDEYSYKTLLEYTGEQLDFLIKLKEELTNEI